MNDVLKVLLGVLGGAILVLLLVSVAFLPRLRGTLQGAHSPPRPGAQGRERGVGAHLVVYEHQPLRVRLLIKSCQPNGPICSRHGDRPGV